MSKNKLTQEKLREVLNYEPTTGIFKWKISSNRLIKTGDIAGCVNNKSGYWQIKINRKIYPAHRLAIFYMTGKFPANLVIHINGKRDDNRFINLKEVLLRKKINYRF
jgi:hypothetical protein